MAYHGISNQFWQILAAFLPSSTFHFLLVPTFTSAGEGVARAEGIAGSG
jgi:hypothetical protein